MINKLITLGPGRILRTAVSVRKYGFTLLALLDAVKHSDAFVKDDAEKISYAELYVRSLQLAHLLHQKYGISSGSRVAIAGTNSTALVRSLFAVSGLGADIFLLNPNQKAAYFSTLIPANRIDVIMGDTGLADELAGLNISFFDHQQTIEGIAHPPRSITKFKKGSITILTGGSTGMPRSEKRKVSAIRFIDPLVEIIDKLRLKDADTVFLSVPIFHGYGMAALLLSVFLGKSVRLTKKFDAEKTQQILNEEKPDRWIIVPRMLQKVLGSGDLKLGHLKTVISGGDVLLPNTVEQLRQASNAKVYNLYGTSETGVCTIATDDDICKYPGTIGKMIRGVNAKTDDKGQLLIKCAWSSDDRNGSYVATGDIVVQNADGYYFYKGRIDDMMVIGGENVYPAELEDILLRHTSIQWAKAMGILTDGIARIHIDIVLADGSYLDKDEFMQWLSGQVPGYMMPKSITVLSIEPASKLVQ
ncbi:class I adenylate-forming enzyme family protein [Flavobacterium sp.]|uniref:class I adenylate-forming enzyme family protein n=1 Tax=Flavobacterium sp. TaxID=239 RepID=UPI0040334E6C